MKMQWISYYQNFFGNRVEWGRGVLPSIPNEHFEELSRRRYNYSPATDRKRVRLVFPKQILSRHPHYKTLVRKGRALWCFDLKYAGVSPAGYRQFSFHLKGGKKRFTVEERDALCIPVHCSVIPVPWRPDHKVFTPFGTVFGYEQALQLMFRNRDDLGLSYNDFLALLDAASPFKPGALVRPRLRYYYPRKPREEVLIDLAEKFSRREPMGFTPVGELKEYIRSAATNAPPQWEEFIEWCLEAPEAQHPYGLVLATSLSSKTFYATEFYRISFGDHIYEDIHPFELEIIKNEV